MVMFGFDDIVYYIIIVFVLAIEMYLLLNNFCMTVKMR